jgi:hypothetical protein
MCIYGCRLVFRDDLAHSPRVFIGIAHHTLLQRLHTVRLLLRLTLTGQQLRDSRATPKHHGERQRCERKQSRPELHAGLHGSAPLRLR